MLYKFDEKDKKLESVSYMNMTDLKKLEKDLENLLAKNLFEVLFEDSPLMPIFQERKRQPEADLYALDQYGNLVIFELKREIASGDAAIQVLRYAQNAGQWKYNKLNELYGIYTNNSTCSLVDEHSEAFALESPLPKSEFNKNQKLFVIGNAADVGLIEAIDYWKSKLIDIDFIPYRIYEIAGKKYFEFFSKPYDIHDNEKETKAVLFDTNRSYNENSVWDMLSKKRVAAYGDVAYCAEYLNKGDIVLYSHKRYGIIAAAEVTSKKAKINPNNTETEEKYHDVKFLTPVPKNYSELKALSFRDVSDITGKSFYWARTIKVPYLTYEMGIKLVEKITELYNSI